MAKNNNLTDFLTGLANKFRTVLGTSGTINPQNFEDLVDDSYTKGYNDHFLKIASGTFELDEDSNTYTQSGIVDAEGNAFTPNVVVAMLFDETATTHNLGAHRVIGFFRRYKESFATRICTYGSAVDVIRTNPSNSGITLGSGYFKYTTSTSAYYLAKGTYAWIALREE